MRRTDLERSKTVLLGLLRQLELPQRSREGITIENASDMIDQVQYAAERDMAVRRIDLDFDRLRNIRLALERVKDGSYGICIRCDEEIGSKRLKALPWVSRCVRCQDLEDRQNGQYSGGARSVVPAEF